MPDLSDTRFPHGPGVARHLLDRPWDIVTDEQDRQERAERAALAAERAAQAREVARRDFWVEVALLAIPTCGLIVMAFTVVDWDVTADEMWPSLLGGGLALLVALAFRRRPPGDNGN